MDNVKYLERLKTEIIAHNYTVEYAELCCEYAERLLNNGLPVIFDRQHLAELIGTTADFIDWLIHGNCYTIVSIPKKGGGERTIEIPIMELKYIQRWILDNILSKYKVSDNAMGFVNHRSILDNAKMHLNKKCLINMDIKDFFPSILYKKVFRLFNYSGYSKKVSYILAKLCTYQNRLPQGSPASPAISNLVCYRLDYRLSHLAEKYNAIYSRYADDITFSSNSNISRIVDAISTIIRDEGFSVNDSKTRVLFSHQRQEVTGLIVNNDIVRVNKRYKRKLSQEIYYCQRFGIKSHMKRINCDKSFYKEHLYGKAYFIAMVEPECGARFLSDLDKVNWEL